MLPETKHAIAAVFLLALAAFAAPALCQTQEEYQVACQDDALRFCSEHVPDHAKIRSCLVANKASLTPACRAMVSPAKKKRKQS